MRLGASTGIGLILSEVAAGGTNLPAYMDVYLNIASLWGGVSFRRLSFFLRPELKLALGVANPNLLGRFFILLGNTFVPVTLGAVLKL